MTDNRVNEELVRRGFAVHETAELGALLSVIREQQCRHPKDAARYREIAQAMRAYLREDAPIEATELETVSRVLVAVASYLASLAAGGSFTAMEIVNITAFVGEALATEAGL